jgi:TetR/AcrR family transcriptional regulator
MEATLRQAVRLAQAAGDLPADLDVTAHANALIAFVTGRWHQFAKSGFTRDPAQHWPEQRRVLLAH